MATGTLTLDHDALVSNWRALDAMTSCDTGACVKADGYGLGAATVARTLAAAGVRRFYVAYAREGAAIRAAVGPVPEIYVFGGHMAGDAAALAGPDLIPLLNSADQVARHREALPDRPFGLQLDSGMNRLGLEPADWAAVRDGLGAARPAMVMSHLACADDPAHPMNAHQLAAFREMTADVDAPRSLAATGGLLIGPDYHFDMTRPGIGLYGGLPFADATQVARLDLPVIQIRDVAPGETVGYGNTWTAARPTRVATVAAGYADGLIRAMGNEARFWAGDTPCPLVGRVSMDLITVDVTAAPGSPDALEVLGPHQGVDDLAAATGTIGYEILTSLGDRYTRA